MVMENVRTPFLSSLFPWLAPFVLKFEIVDGGIGVQLYRNQQLRENWQPSDLRRILPPELITWMEQYRIHQMLLPYPVAKQFWQAVSPHASKKLVIDMSTLAYLDEANQAYRIVLTWELRRATEWIVGRFDGADRYLGMGWFQTGNKVWALQNQLSAAADAQLKNLTLPLHQANHLLATIIPTMNQFLPTCADFQLITDFAPQVIVADARSGGLILKLQCNYPHLLATLQVPRLETSKLLADKAVIVFPQQARTPVLMQLLQSRLSITVQGANVPQIIREQLPIMRQYRQISDEMAEKITRANPIISITSLKSIPSFTHTLEYGLGKYALVTKYFYNQYEIDVAALLAARQQGQRFIQQHNIWFEWPANSHNLAQTIQQQLVAQALRPEEVMGFDPRRLAALEEKPVVTPQPTGSTPFARSQELFKQLQQHGIPGGIVGEAGTAKMFVDVCEQLWRVNRYAPILWLVPSNKKGSVTRAVNSSTIARYITVASLITLRDEPTLFSRPWTLVIFQDLDHLLDGSLQAGMLPQLKWQWALTSVSSTRALYPPAMRVLHLPEQYFEQFRARYLFDLEKNYVRPMTEQAASRQVTAQAPPSLPQRKAEPARSDRVMPRSPFQTGSDVGRKPEIPLAKSTFENLRTVLRPVRHEIELDPQKIAELHEDADLLQERLTFEDEEQSLPLFSGEVKTTSSAPLASIAQKSLQTPVQVSVNDSVRDVIAQTSAKDQGEGKADSPRSETTSQPHITLDGEVIAKLHDQSDQLQDRLSYETAEHPAIAVDSLPDEPDDPLSDSSDESALCESASDVDEDWREIAQKWKAEHWEIIVAVWQGHREQVEAVAHRVQRPATRLIDEINEPVAEQWEDVLIEPEALTIPEYFHEAAEKLTRWYLASRAS
jgi:hypothetical protein